jgi:hypothetical protein
VWLGGQFVTQGLSDAALTDDPAMAVLLRGDSADAVTALARQRLVGRNNAAAARLAARAVRLDPMNPDALTIYGFAQDQLRAPIAANAAMSVAGELGWRNVLAQVWLLRRDLVARKYAAALDHADAVMRGQQAAPMIVLAVVAAAARDPAAIPLLERHLSAAPAWRQPFFSFLCFSARPPAADLARTLLFDLARGPTPPTESEQAILLARLVGDREYDGAAAAWRFFRPRAAAKGLVYDGDFETAAGPTPFDWSIRQGAGWLAAITDSPEGRGEALRVDYDGVSPPQPLRQLLVLPPGRYRLSGRANVEGGKSPGSLVWSIDCMTTTDVFARAPTPEAANGQWSSFAVEFDVPAGRCPAEWLELTTEAGDLRKDLAVWYDDLALAPLPAAAPPSGGAKAS